MAAEALYSCLVDAGLPFYIEDLGDGQALVGLDFLRVTSARWWAPNGDEGEVAEGIYYPSLLNDAPNPSSPPAGAYLLEIDGADHSETFGTCYESSGYRQPAVLVDPGDELRIKVGITEATNEWVACARIHGFPDLMDLPAPRADSWETSVGPVLLPASVTEEEIRILAAACPIYEQEDTDTPGMTPSEYVPDPDAFLPAVEIALPGNGARSYAELSDAERDRFNLLNAILTGTESALS